MSLDPFEESLVRTMVDSAILWDIRKEQQRIEEKWGPRPHDNSWGTWLGILGEEYGEVCKEVIEHDDGTNLEKELVQVAAVAMGWLIDMRLVRYTQAWEDAREKVDQSVDGRGPSLRG